MLYQPWFRLATAPSLGMSSCSRSQAVSAAKSSSGASRSLCSSSSTALGGVPAGADEVDDLQPLSELAADDACDLRASLSWWQDVAGARRDPTLDGYGIEH